MKHGLNKATLHKQNCDIERRELRVLWHTRITAYYNPTATLIAPQNQSTLGITIVKALHYDLQSRKLKFLWLCFVCAELERQSNSVPGPPVIPITAIHTNTKHLFHIIDPHLSYTDGEMKRYGDYYSSIKTN